MHGDLGWLGASGAICRFAGKFISKIYRNNSHPIKIKIMRKYVMMLCLVLGLGASAVKVSVDENVEFVSSMCRLAGFDEYVNNVNN